MIRFRDLISGGSEISRYFIYTLFKQMLLILCIHYPSEVLLGVESTCFGEALSSVTVCRRNFGIKMPKFCAVIGCSNTYRTSDVALHEFPKQAALRKKWQDFVSVHRTDFSVVGIRPLPLEQTKTGRHKQKAPAICGLHFQSSDYENLMAYTLGFDSKRILKKDAVPSIQPSKETLDKIRASATRSRTSGTSTTASNTVTLSGPSTSDCVEDSYERPRPFKRQRTGSVCEKLDMARLLSPSYIPYQTLPKEKSKKIPVVKKKEVGTAAPMQQSVSIQVGLPAPGKNKGTQVRVRTASLGVQCNLITERPPATEVWQADYEAHSDITVPYEDEFVLDENDPEFTLSSDDWCQERLDAEEDIDSRTVNSSGSLGGQHFIVAGECIEELLQICPICSGPAEVASHKTIGTMLEIKRVCLQPSCGNIHVWRSQRMIRKMATGNLLLSAGILFGGLQPSRTLRLFDHMKIPRISESTYFRHQRLYLEPTILSSWEEEQEKLMAQLQDLKGQLEVCGDGRCDSPGYCAKYGAYSLIESRINRVITTELVQSNEVANSSRMENEGLVRCVDFLDKKSLKIAVIVTDRHKQINAWIRENLRAQGTKHYFDVWHVSKGVGKKIHKLSKLRGCSEAGIWRKAIINHLYWSAGSTSDGDSDMMKAKWVSCLNHMINIHEGHGTHFPECEHGPVEGVKWLHPGSEVMEKLSDIVENKYLLADIGRLSPNHQTSALESFHALIICFAPKATAFSYMGMKCRIQLAAMHYNENADRQLAFTALNEPKFCVAFSRSSYGDPFVRQEKVKPTFNYVDALKTKLFQWYSMSPDAFSKVLATYNIPPTLASMREKPSTEELLKKRVRRFVES